jgi:hypothetical protein
VGFEEGASLPIVVITLRVHIPLRIVGFLFGFSLASSFAAYHLLEEYKQASSALQTCVEDLRVSTEKVRPPQSACNAEHQTRYFRFRPMFGE